MTDKYFEDENLTLYLEDSLKILQDLPSESYEMIFADPPYFLSNGGVTVQSGKFVNVDKGEWDKKRVDLNIDEFNDLWIKECKRLLKPNGTIWISGTHHNIYSVGYLLNKNDWKILNNITWYKPNASPNLSCRYFTHSNEQIIWAKKNSEAKHPFNYQDMKALNEDKQMRDVWTIPLTPKSEKRYGKHPTQKPLKLLERIILASTNSGDNILDPFNGSGTTGIAAVMHDRVYTGIDLETDYLNITIERYKNLNKQETFNFI